MSNTNTEENLIKQTMRDIFYKNNTIVGALQKLINSIRSQIISDVRNILEEIKGINASACSQFLEKLDKYEKDNK